MDDFQTLNYLKSCYMLLTRKRYPTLQLTYTSNHLPLYKVSSCKISWLNISKDLSQTHHTETVSYKLIGILYRNFCKTITPTLYTYSWDSHLAKGMFTNLLGVCSKPWRVSCSSLLESERRAPLKLCSILHGNMFLPSCMPFVLNVHSLYASQALNKNECCFKQFQLFQTFPLPLEMSSVDIIN